MEDRKEKMNPFFKILILLFIIFIGFYIALESGYYPSKVEKDTILTNKEIMKFEKDLNNGKIVDSSGYIKESKNYSNIVTKTGNALTYSLGKIFTEGSKGISSVFKYLFG